MIFLYLLHYAIEFNNSHPFSCWAAAVVYATCYWPLSVCVIPWRPGLFPSSPIPSLSAQDSVPSTAAEAELWLAPPLYNEVPTQVNVTLTPVRYLKVVLCQINP